MGGLTEGKEIAQEQIEKVDELYLQKCKEVNELRAQVENYQRCFKDLVARLKECPTRTIAVLKVLKMCKEISEHVNRGSAWIPVKSGILPTVPEGTRDSECPEFNVTFENGVVSTLRYSADGHWFGDNGLVYEDVIAWQQLPLKYIPKAGE